ncbi:MAG: Tfx family DNA-binding protein, partial [Acidilobaceae archaeon]
MEGSKKKGFLTIKQLEVLKLRAQGYTQSNIADIMKTTRENIAVIERRAKSNLIRAIETIVSYIESVSLAKVEIKKGENTYIAVKRILREANNAKVKLKEHMPEIIDILKRIGGEEDGKLNTNIIVYIQKDGSINLITIPDKKKRIPKIC